eukprot:12776410-Alexandrium_andersonii.AAC.1
MFGEGAGGPGYTAHGGSGDGPEIPARKREAQHLEVHEELNGERANGGATASLWAASVASLNTLQ